MPSSELDLSGLAPKTISLRLSETETIEISSDQPSLLVSRAGLWEDDYLRGNGFDYDRKFTDDEGWEITNEICGQDMRRIGVLGMVKLLHFFRYQTSQAAQEIFSELPFGLPESSTDQSASENSSEAEPSSGNASSS